MAYNITTSSLGCMLSKLTTSFATMRFINKKEQRPITLIVRKEERRKQKKGKTREKKKA